MALVGYRKKDKKGPDGPFLLCCLDFKFTRNTL